MWFITVINALECLGTQGHYNSFGEAKRNISNICITKFEAGRFTLKIYLK